MAQLYKQLNPAISQYKDRRFCGTQQEFDECLRTSTTVYVGNLSFYTTEDQIFEVRSSWVRSLPVGGQRARTQRSDTDDGMVVAHGTHDCCWRR